MTGNILPQFVCFEFDTSLVYLVC